MDLDRDRRVGRWRLRSVLNAVAAAVAATAQAGAWFVPFVAGVAAGVASLRWRRMVPPAVFASVAGWAIPLWALVLRGLPAGATARAVASLAGLPPYAAVTIVATLLLAALQALVGAWLPRALLPRRGSFHDRGSEAAIYAVDDPRS